MKLFKRVIVAVLSLTLVIILSPPRVNAQGLGTLLALGKLLTESAKAVEVFAVAVERLLESGTRVYDLIAARKAESRLKEISAQTSILIGVQSVRVVDRIDRYLAQPTPENWKRFQDGLPDVLRLVNDLLQDVQKERSGFIVEQQAAFEEFVASLSRRHSLLTELLATPAPQSKEEIDALRLVREQYAQLMNSLRRANRAISIYVNSIEPAKSKEQTGHLDVPQDRAISEAQNRTNQAENVFSIKGPNDERFPLIIEVTGTYKPDGNSLSISIAKMVIEVDPKGTMKEVATPLITLERCGVLPGGYFEVRKHTSANAQNFLVWPMTNVSVKKRIVSQNYSRRLPISQDSATDDWFCVFVRNDLDGKTRYIHASNRSLKCSKCDSFPIE